MSDDILVRTGKISERDLVMRLGGFWSATDRKAREKKAFMSLLPPPTSGYEMVEIQTTEDLWNKVILYKITERKIPGHPAVTPNPPAPVCLKRVQGNHDAGMAGVNAVLKLP